MTFREITFDSTEYAAELKLREKVLRAPLGKTLSPSDLADETNQLHFGMFDADELIACVLIAPLSKTNVKLRQMAIAPALQGRGIGRQLILATEQVVAGKGYESIEMAARATAVGFYNKLGYVVVGEPYLELGIEHITMRKLIALTSIRVHE